MFEACVETGAAAFISMSGWRSRNRACRNKAHEFVGAFTGCFRFYDSPIRMAEMIYTGLLDRFPDPAGECGPRSMSAGSAI